MTIRNLEYYRHFDERNEMERREISMKEQISPHPPSSDFVEMTITIITVPNHG